MNVTFYSNFTKRKNSTLRPSGAGTVHSVRLKERCPLLQPVFIFEGQHFSYNYCIWNGRYYFVTDAVPVANNLYEVSCTVDVLATYRSEIAAYNAFVERSASSYDVMLNDPIVSSSSAISNMQSATIEMTDIKTLGDLIYLVPVYGCRGVNIYAFPRLTDAGAFFNSGTTLTIAGQQFTWNDFVTALKNTGFAFAASDVTAYMGDIIFSPYLPNETDALDITNDLIFGETIITSPTQLNLLKPSYFYRIFTLTLTDPGNIYNDFRARDPRFSEYKIFLPGCGEFPINSADAGAKDLKIDVSVDFTSCAITYRIYHNKGTPVAVFDGHFGCTVPVAGTRIDMFGFVQDTAGIISGGMSQNWGGMASSAVNVLQRFLEPQLSAKNIASGNAAMARRFPRIIYSVKNFDSKDIPQAVAGRPHYTNMQLGTLSGFVKCGNAAVPIAGFDSEKEELNSYLNTGFYFE